MKKIRLLVAVFLIVLGVCAARGVYVGVSGAADMGEEHYVIVDAGHGGVDSGKVGVDGTLEKDLNLAIAKKLAALLEEIGYKVALTRTEDTGLYDEDSTSRKADDLRNRCLFINKEAPDLVVSIHQNSYTDASPHGAQVFYYTHSEQAAAYADIFQEEFCKIDDSNTRAAKANDTYYLLKKTEVPTVIAECGFLSNPTEAARLSDPDYQDQLAQALCEGVERCLDSATAK